MNDPGKSTGTKVTETEPLFPELVVAEGEAEIAAEVPNPCEYNISILAYWPRGGYWKIHAPLAYAHDERFAGKISAAAKDLRERGWTHIYTMRLPRGDFPWNTP